MKNNYTEAGVKVRRKIMKEMEVFHRKNGKWPSHLELAKSLKKAESTIRFHIHKLHKIGVLKCEGWNRGYQLK